MTPVEIEEAISQLAADRFDRVEFPYQFLAAFGNKETTLKKLRAGASNASDIPGGVLQRNNIHIATCDHGQVDACLQRLRESPKTASAKAKFILATDGAEFQAEDLVSGETVSCRYGDFHDHFGFFLPLAGITTVKQIRESAFDIKATGRLNRLYVQLLKDNPDWAGADRREDMNKFMARLIFCFFAEDTDIIHPSGLFTKTVEQMGAGDASDTHRVISEIFRAMDVKIADREAAGLPVYAKKFPYVNGALFSGSTECPRFTKIARSYLLHIGSLDWQKINPDIFGSMIQAVADDEERGALGMHYTSVPNILKVLNPLFLDDLREKLEEAGDNSRKLLNLRNRIAKIRVFDPACGSGNFLVIAYKEMRAIEAEINRRRGEADRRSDIPITNFRGIELRDFAAEVARLALIIAEYQCDVLYRGQKEALAEFLPLSAENWITCGNALRLDWLSICPPTGMRVKVRGDDLFETPLDQSEVDFKNVGGETYICGNPPYLGKGKKGEEQLADIEHVLARRLKKWGYVDLVGCWFLLAADYIRSVPDCQAALVATNSLCQGRQLPQLWPHVLKGVDITFCHRSFVWSNSAMHNAGIICIIVALSSEGLRSEKKIFEDGLATICAKISPYLTSGDVRIVDSRPTILSDGLGKMETGSVINDGGNLLLSGEEKSALLEERPYLRPLLKRYVGAQDAIHNLYRHCFSISDNQLNQALSDEYVQRRLQSVSDLRAKSPKKETRDLLAKNPHRFQHTAPIPKRLAIVMPRVSSERRPYLPAIVLPCDTIVSDTAFYLCDADLWNLSILTSRMHLAWVGTVCGKLKNDFRYSNTLGWNTFPLPELTEQNKADLTACAENILLAREAHFPATIADLYDPEAMPDNLRSAHEENDEVLERIYIGRRFKNDTERLEKLFELYTKMTAKGKAA